ncbi:sigma-70 family RNA polymerase sigma factor [Sporosarcina sp. Marseille-Q4063]|uniref:sigma-70 family RNA polymerase sigma factor n=1 Tax=Sporosarcina sp. Marseille-Q4063 TaxID=2810514 RepID=UPI001BB0556A|nr:sigma-70 family RNA polymerase sigma factor [Sporosarcina sp. Marseille-Q4063]QUW22474.1 sigma-70 family RNA polymerase sigma factor [Sporosarcina sp. Marseille-Q4063]
MSKVNPRGKPRDEEKLSDKDKADLKGDYRDTYIIEQSADDKGVGAQMEKNAQLIRDYNWMKNEIDRLQGIIWGGSAPIRSWGVAQYGIESVMPKVSRGKSYAELEALDIREKNQLDRLEKYERHVYALEKALDVLKDERQKIIYDCLLDEMTYRHIALHLARSKYYVRNQRNDIIGQISQSSQINAILTGEKQVV